MKKYSDLMLNCTKAIIESTNSQDFVEKFLNIFHYIKGAVKAAPF